MDSTRWALCKWAMLIAAGGSAPAWARPPTQLPDAAASREQEGAGAGLIQAGRPSPQHTAEQTMDGRVTRIRSKRLTLAAAEGQRTVDARELDLPRWLKKGEAVRVGYRTVGKDLIATSVERAPSQQGVGGSGGGAH